METIRQTLRAAEPTARDQHAVADLVAAVCAASRCHGTALQEGSRRAAVARAREGIAYLALEICGYAAPTVADSLGVRPSAVYRAAQRAQASATRWDRLLGDAPTEQTIRKQRMTTPRTA